MVEKFSASINLVMPLIYCGKCRQLIGLFTVYVPLALQFFTSLLMALAHYSFMVALYIYNSLQSHC